MAAQSSRAAYDERMHRVLDYIDRNLDRSLGLDELAAVAHFSAFHFHRVFAAWTNETLGDYVRRRRVELAAVRLTAQPRVSILSVALSVGFGSTEAFARAFKARFGCTATEWRHREAARRHPRSPRQLRSHAEHESNPDQSISKRDQAIRSDLIQHDDSHQPALEKVMQVVVIERQPVKVAYLRHVGPYGEPISRFWQGIAYPWMVTNHLLGLPRYGVSHDDPTVTAPEKCRYDACVETNGQLVVPGNGLTAVIPGGQYAIAKFRGRVDAIGAVWDQLLRAWLPDSGLQLDARPFFEYYPTDSTYDPATGIFTCDIAVPVVPV